jgi:hypothetical protein
MLRNILKVVLEYPEGDRRVSIGKITTTRPSKARWVGLAVVVALQFPAPAFADYCDVFICPPPCSDGDPHLRTENGVAYDFQGAGEFVLLRDPNGLEIQTRQSPVAAASFPRAPNPHDGLASCVSLNTAVAVRLGSRRVSYAPRWRGGPDASPSSLELRVDGKLETLGPSGLAYSDGSSILPTASPGGLMITFPDRSTLQVTPGWWPPYSTWYLNVGVGRPKNPSTCACQAGNFTRGGLLGAIPPGGWLPALPDGSSMGTMPTNLHDRYVALHQKFADAWRVNDKSSLFDYAPGTSTASFTTRNWPPEQGPCALPKTQPAPPAKLEQPATEAVATNACSGITDEVTRKSCVFDVKVTGNLDFAKTYVAAQKDRAGLTKITLTNAQNTTIELTPATFVVAVTSLAGGKGTPAGTVHIWGDGFKVPTPLKLDAKGQATWTNNQIKPGSHSFLATYEPVTGSGFVGSSSQPVTHTVQKK